MEACIGIPNFSTYFSGCNRPTPVSISIEERSLDSFPEARLGDFSLDYTSVLALADGCKYFLRL